MKKKTDQKKQNDRRQRHEPHSPKQRVLAGIKISQLAAGGTAVHGAAKASSSPLALVARTPNRASVTAAKGIEEATRTASAEALHTNAASTGLDLGLASDSAADDKAVSPNAAAPAHAEWEVNGELLTIDSLQSLAPEEREIVRQSDVAFVGVRQTWEGWKQVRAGLVLLRDLAMREAGANDPKSKLYKDRFHELLEQRAYRSTKMDPSTRKALLKCAELAPEIDEWHDRLGDHRRLRLNHPINVLHAFRKAQDPPSPPDQSAQTKHELELEKVRQESVAAVASRDERINELQQQIDTLSKPVDISDAAVSDINNVVQYVIATCGGAEVKIRQVVRALTAYLERRPS
jgi:hypothetical protein